MGFDYQPIGAQNRRSQRAAEKIGAVRTGTRPDAGGRLSYLYHLTPSNLLQRP